jgi:flagellar biosynthesis/type III secretory pathway chaperone
VKGNSVTPQHVKIVKEDYKKLIETAQRVYAEMERLQQENQKLRYLLNKNLGKEGKAVTPDTEQSSTASTIATSDSRTNAEDLKSDCSKQ